MKKLGFLTWEQVTEEYMIMYSYKVLSEYFIASKDWVSIIYLKFSILVYYIFDE